MARGTDGQLPEGLALVINLAAATGRRTFQERQLAERGIPGEFLAATAVTDVPAAEMERLRRTWARPLRATEVCCTLSHRRAWDRVAHEGRPRLILEDDAILAPSLAPLLAELLGRRDLDYVTLETYVHPKRLSPRAETLATPPYRLARLYRDRGGAAAYLLWPAGAAKLLRATERVLPLADSAIDLAPGLRRHQAEPAAAIQAMFLAAESAELAALFGAVSPSLITAETLPRYGSRAEWLRFKARRLAVSLRLGVRRLAAWRSELRHVGRAPDLGRG